MWIEGYVKHLDFNHLAYPNVVTHVTGATVANRLYLYVAIL